MRARGHALEEPMHADADQDREERQREPGTQHVVDCPRAMRVEEKREHRRRHDKEPHRFARETLGL